MAIFNDWCNNHENNNDFNCAFDDNSTNFSHTVRLVKLKKYKDNDLEITTKLQSIHNNCSGVVDIENKQKKTSASLLGAYASISRCHSMIHDLLRCNFWQYFITLTFADDGYKYKDEFCKEQFRLWRQNIKRSFPNMYYLVVPEYHEKGGLHFHVVVGGTTADELKLVDSGRVLHYGKAWKREDFIARGFVFDDQIGEGATIFNVDGWKVGFSTATEVRDTEAVTHYVSKYISKSNIDARFFKKKRYYVSHNINRPKILTFQNSTSLYSAKETHDIITDLGGELIYRKRNIAYSKYDVSKDCPLLPH